MTTLLENKSPSAPTPAYEFSTNDLYPNMTEKEIIKNRFDDVYSTNLGIIHNVLSDTNLTMLHEYLVEIKNQIYGDFLNGKYGTVLNLIKNFYCGNSNPQNMYLLQEKFFHFSLHFFAMMSSKGKHFKNMDVRLNKKEHVHLSDFEFVQCSSVKYRYLLQKNTNYNINNDNTYIKSIKVDIEDNNSMTLYVFAQKI